MLSLALALVASLSPVPLDAPGTKLTLPIAATDVQVRFVVPAWADDAARLPLLRQTGGEHVLAAGTLGSTDLRVTIMGGPNPDLNGDACRKGILGERLLGMGLSTVAGYATAQTIRTLNPPYREFDRHAFLLGANAMAHVQIIALEQGDPEQFGDARFEALLASARFAVVRRTAWDDLPERYLELSHAAARRADGLAWLREQAAAPGAGWIEKLVAVEHAHSIRSTEPFVRELGTAVRAELQSKAERTRFEDAGLLLAEDGLGLALLRAGDAAGAEAHLNVALALASRFGDRTVAGVTASLVCLQAAKNDADGVVALLTQAYAKDPALRYRIQRDPLIDSVRKDPRVEELLTIRLKAPSNKQLGGH
ncbi:MAG: hypothetical protein NTY35_10205 [Planctomycetota bacterium]|nr:hypothetical protein [Planctomycetota bacterium]